MLTSQSLYLFMLLNYRLMQLTLMAINSLQTQKHASSLGKASSQILMYLSFS